MTHTDDQHTSYQQSPTNMKQSEHPQFDAPRIDSSAVNEPEPEVIKRRTRLKNYAYDKTPKKLKNASDLQVRVRTGAIYVSVTVICLLIGAIPSVLMLSATAGVCASEFYYMLRHDAKLPNEALGICAAVLYPPAVYWAGMTGAFMVSLALMIALLVWYVFWNRARIADVCVSFFGAAYTGMLLSCVVLLRGSLEEPYGGILAVVVYCGIWANDAFAYLIGSKFGKHKLAPRISPKKSWEGFIAGIIATMGIWCVLLLIPGVNISIWQALGFGAICGVVGVLGDLAESRIKRNSGVKDSGTIMPGHGGLLDRCDSLFLSALVAVVLLSLGGCITLPL